MDSQRSVVETPPARYPKVHPQVVKHSMRFGARRRPPAGRRNCRREPQGRTSSLIRASRYSLCNSGPSPTANRHRRSIGRKAERACERGVPGHRHDTSRRGEARAYDKEFMREGGSDERFPGAGPSSSAATRPPIETVRQRAGRGPERQICRAARAAVVLSFDDVVVRADRDVPGEPRRLWVTFEVSRPPIFGLVGDHPLGDVLRRGCGVTGLDEEDCWRRVRDLFGDRPLPECREVVFDVDVSTLDPVHVLPGVGNPAVLGVWFPKSLA
jgi:hypothetical protein